MGCLLVRGDLVDTFEEQFGHFKTSGQGVWSELSKKVASKLSKRVFAIASFKGNYYGYMPIISRMVF